MRLFVAIDLPEAARTALEQLRADIPGAVWTKRQAQHLTLQFLGDPIPRPRLAEITAALGAVHSRPFALTLAGVGRFPAGGRQPPRVLWAGIEPEPSLAALHRQVTAATSSVGFASEARDFSPHITLARLKDRTAGPAVDRFLERCRGFRFDAFPVTEFILFSSLLTPRGSRYTREAVFPLRE
jgi:RNA 2',3'-cyclic 3'-phosphodiesterase